MLDELRPKSWTKKDRVMKRNENYPKYVQAMRLMDAGKLPYTVAKDLHMGIDTIKRIRRRYLTGGELALLSPAYTPHLAAEKKEEILLSIQEKGLSLQQAAVEYGISKQSLRCWRKAYKQSGLAGLSRSCSEKAMGKKRQRTEAELDELEVLRKRNEYLEAENALLKKVKALVEEREARLRAIGQKPSKN
jgi:transposase-like protein